MDKIKINSGIKKSGQYSFILLEQQTMKSNDRYVLIWNLFIEN